MKTPELTPAVRSAVNAYLISKAHAQLMREDVDKVYTELFDIYPLYTDRYSDQMKPRRIYNQNDMYLSKDDATCQDIYRDIDITLKERKIKPEDMEWDHCPALVAESMLTKCEWLICDAAVEMLDLEFDGKTLNHKLLCLGLDKYKKFIDLIVTAVVKEKN